MSRIFFVSPVAFAALHQRHQSLAVELARREHQTVFADPLKSGGYSCKCSVASACLKIAQLQVPFKGVSCPGLQMFAARFAMQLAKEKLLISPADTVLWLGEPSLAWLTRLKWKSIIYDRCDLHGSFPGQNRRAWQKYENMLFTRADLITCSHQYLQETLPERARNQSLLVGNASANIFFAQNRRASAGNGKLKLVSAGAHHEWVDTDWLKMLSSQPGTELHLAGTGRGKGYEDLRRQPGVVDHGRLTQTELASLLKDCDIGLVPFCDIELIRGVDPVKVYEYAASGLTVWAPPLAALRSNPLISRFIATRDELAEAIVDRAKPKTAPAPRIARWSERLQTVLDRLDALRSD